MAGPDDRGGEDLFEDLDQYFAPIEDVDWPAETGAAAPASGQANAPEPPQDDILIDLRGAATEPAPAVSPASAGGAPGGTLSDPPPRASAAGPPGEEPPGEPTAEMSGEDWKRLRDVLGDDDDAPEPVFPGGFDEPAGAPAPPEEPQETQSGPGEEDRAEWGPPGSAEPPGAAGPAEPGAAEARDLTLDDLKKAPPEYGELPGPLEAPQARVPSAAEAAEVFAAAPEPTDVEQAAERFAESIRVETGEHPPVTAEPAPEAAGEPAPVSDTDLRWEDEDDLVPAAVGMGLGTGAAGEEPLPGPAWEESVSDTVGGDHPGGPSERDLPAAMITAAVLVAAALVSIAISKAAFAVVAGGVVLLAQAELYATMQRRGYQPATALGLVVGAMLLAAAYLRGENAMLMFVAMGTMLSFLWYMVAPAKVREGAVRNIGATVLGIVYVPFLAGYALILLSAPSGRALVLSVLGLTFLYDVAAFAVGSFYGRRPLAPSISPKKSWEGLLGATVVTVAVGLALLPSISPIDPSLARAAGMAVIIVVFAPLGDLAESLIKRDLHVKDMGTLLPGHGGVLDRIDSALFVVPAALYFLRLVLG